MDKISQVQLKEITGGDIWISTEDGQKVFEKIKEALSHSDKVEISFSGREIFITAFLNVAIGQLYGFSTLGNLDERLVFVDIEKEDAGMLARAIQNAKRYFANQKGYDTAWKDHTNDSDE